MDIKTFFEKYGCFQYHKQIYKNASTGADMIQHMYFFSYNVTKRMQTTEMLESIKNMFALMKTNFDINYNIKETDIMLNIKISKFENMKKLIKYIEENNIKPISRGYEAVKTFVLSKEVVANEQKTE